MLVMFKGSGLCVVLTYLCLMCFQLSPQVTFLTSPGLSRDCSLGYLPVAENG